MSDLGLTHIALEVSNINKSILFYEKYAQMKVVHRRVDKISNVDVVWISDLNCPFAIVLIQSVKVKGKLSPESHLGVACKSRDEVDRLCYLARSEGLLLKGPNDWGFPVGYWAYIRDPDGHTLEISYGQELQLTLESEQLV
ncbi:MAG: VOC family protein [Prochloraceae cyanobacterium]|nr:VOC family protein [Prochloraceae cyanobacterium]